MLAVLQNYTKNQMLAMGSLRQLLFSFVFLAVILRCGIVIAAPAVSAYDSKNEEPQTEAEFVAQCQKDINFIKQAIDKHSAGYKNKKDSQFQKWYQQGVREALELAGSSKDQDDCYYAARYLLTGFDDNRIAIRPLIRLPKEQYPGLLTALINGKHQVIYKNNNLLYLRDVKLGDELISINEVPIAEYFKEYIEPFYANNNSIIEQKTASLYSLILDGNSYRPIASSARFKREEIETNIKLRYTHIDHSASDIINSIAKPSAGTKLKIDSFKGGAWIRLPSFYPTDDERILLRGILSSLKDIGAKQDYIVFDVRGNLGGKRHWPIAIMRNLFGDQYIKSLGKKHSYNIDWQYDYRVSKDNFYNFKRLNSQFDIKGYASALTKKKNYFKQNYKIWQEKSELFSQQHQEKIKAKIIVVTDNFCSGSCWNFVHALKQMPNTQHVGLTTNTENRYLFHRPFRAPSGNFELYLPTALISNNPAPYNTVLKPSVRYHDDISKDLNVIEWVLNNFRQKK